MSTCCGEGNGAASTAKATAKGVRNVTADRRRISFAGFVMARQKQRSIRERLACRSAGAISGWRFPRDLAGHLRALRGDRCADTARRVEILERRSAGGLRDP